MLPYPLYHQFTVCPEAPQRTNETWADCAEIEQQAVTFAAYFGVMLVLAVAACLAKDNSHTDKAVASMLRLTLAAEIAISVCLVADGVATLAFDICRQFPLMPLGMFGSLGLATNQWLASSCLYFRNWMVTLVALTRYRMFKRRRPMQWRTFNVTAGFLAVNAALFALPQAFHSVGRVCSNDLLGPVHVAPLLFSVQSTSVYDVVNAVVVIPLQAVLPFLLGFGSSLAVMRILWQHMRQQPGHQPLLQLQVLHLGSNGGGGGEEGERGGGGPGGNVGGLSTHHLKRYKRPFVAFLVMNATLVLLYLPAVVIRILAVLKFDINSYFWMSNALCNAISLSNIAVYFYLCKTCNCTGGAGPAQQSAAVTSC